MKAQLEKQPAGHSSEDLSHDKHEPHMEPIRPQPQGGIFQVASHASGPDHLEPPPPPTGPGGGYSEEQDVMYDRLSSRRKITIVTVFSFCAFLSPISSTSVLSAIPEVASEFHTTGSIIDLSNAAYMALMGISPLIWGPISQVFGRRPVALVLAVVFFGLSIGTALAPNLAAFFVFRALTAFVGTAFILVGSAGIADIYRPAQRGTAVGWYMSGTLTGPAFGPFIGGIIVTYSSWRTIFWLQTALAGAGLLGVYFLVPETIHVRKLDSIEGSPKTRAVTILRMINPLRVLAWLFHINILLVALTSSALVWNMYGLLTPIRYVLNPRFHLQSPLLGSLFYLAPGVGYIVGTFGGGRWADWVVKYWTRKRGTRIPEDRLYSVLPWSGIVMPACILIYGWTVDKAKGGIAVPVIMLFLQGVSQLLCFPALNTYCLDAVPGQGAEIAAANFFLRYIAGCVGTAVVLPIVDSIGVGWFSTISALLMSTSTATLLIVVKRGNSWTEKVKKHIAEPNTPQTSSTAYGKSGDVEKAQEQ